MFWNRNKNTKFTTKDTIVNQMNERRPLPLGRQEFEEWSERIIAGAMIPLEKGASTESLKFALADSILHLGPTESHKEDAYFIHMLRKCACNQVADTMRREIRDTAKARLAKDEEANKLKLINGESQVLADNKVQGT